MNRAGVVRRLLLLSTLVSWLSPSCGAASNLPSATPADAVGASAMATPTAVNSPASTRWAAGTEAAGPTSAALATATASAPTPWAAGTEAAAATSASLTVAAGMTPTPWVAGTEAAAATSAALTAAAGMIPTPWFVGTETASQTAEAGRWVTVVGNSVTFESPGYWHPTRTAPADALSDAWALAIPEAASATISFGGAGLERFRPPRELIIVESLVTIGGKPGFKWIRRTQVGGSDVLYEYMTTGLNDEGVFGFSVLLHEMDPSVELQLDRLAETVVFVEGR